MITKRKLAMAGLTLSMAFAAAQYLQDSPTLTGPAAAATGLQAPETLLTGLVLPSAPEMPPLPTTGRLPNAPSDNGVALALPSEPTTPPPQSITCEATLDLRAADRAMLQLSLTAPCHRNQRVVLRHAGLAVTARTSAEGRYVGMLPAMDAGGAVSVLFGDGETAEAALAVPEIAGITRYGVQWLAEDAFQIREDGDQESGQLVRLGDAQVALPMQAEVHTVSRGAGHRAVLEVAITSKTCGRELLGEIIESKRGRSLVNDLSVAMPGCDAVGGYLLLKNLSEDVTVAAAD